MDFYDLLGVSPDAGPEEVRQAFRQQVREYHPDLNDDPRAPAQFTALKKAYDTLADPKERDAYDRLGHEEYVTERISGLPSIDHWQIPDDAEIPPESDDTDDADHEEADVAADTTATGRAAHDGAAQGPTWGPARDADGVGDSGSGPETETETETRADVDVDFDFDFDFEFDDDFDDTHGDDVSPESGAEPTGATPGSASESAGAAVRTDEGPSMDGFVIGSDDASEPDSLADSVEFDEQAFDATDVSKSPTASGAGTARGPKTAPDPGEPSDSTPSATDEYIEDDAGDDSPPVIERLRSGFQWLLGWPLVGLADGLYLGTLLAYYLVNAEGVGRLLERLAAGTPVSEVLASRYGIEGLSGLVAGGSAAPVASVVLLGVAVLPSVYFLLVRWTRRTRRDTDAWTPSYLYVAGAAAPAAGMLLSALVRPSGIALDLVAYVAVPLWTMWSLLFFGQLLPRSRRLVRSYAYRLRN